MEMFTPSLDWGTETIVSLIWVAKAWAITAVSMLLVLTVIARFTTWGRQFWRVTGDYFKGRDSIRVWALLAVLLLSVMMSVRIDVVLSYYSNDQFTALQVAFEGAGAGNAAVRDSGIHGFWFSILVFVRVGHDPHRPHPGRPVSDAALHHRVAGVADPSG